MKMAIATAVLSVGTLFQAAAPLSSTTSNLAVTSASLGSSGELTCLVNSTSPLYIKEIVFEGIVGLGAPVGVVRPGTAGQPAVRTIFLDTTSPVFSTAAPFTLAVTYDNVNYRVSAIVAF